jgi:hypothetical protein
MQVRRHLLALVLLTFVATAAWAIEPPAALKVPRTLLKARLDAARRTYDVLARNFIESRPPLGELVYRWSCRWLDAERDLSAAKSDQVAAYRAHLVRMRELEKVALDRYRERYSTIDEASAAQFYRLEAEIWLLRAETR